MSIIFRPHRGTLTDDMNAAKEFDNEEEMMRFIERDSNGFITAKDIIIDNDNIFHDERISWINCRHVLTMRFGNQDCFRFYGGPQIIGICATIHPGIQHNSRNSQKPEPKYGFGQMLNISSRGLRFNNVIVTKRSVTHDFDRGFSDSKFIYDLKHNIENPKYCTSWSSVPEIILDAMVENYKLDEV